MTDQRCPVISSACDEWTAKVPHAVTSGHTWNRLRERERNGQIDGPEASLFPSFENKHTHTHMHKHTRFQKRVITHLLDSSLPNKRSLHEEGITATCKHIMASMFNWDFKTNQFTRQSSWYIIGIQIHLISTWMVKSFNHLLFKCYLVFTFWVDLFYFL